jgi:hypothetical protein
MKMQPGRNCEAVGLNATYHAGMTENLEGPGWEIIRPSGSWRRGTEVCIDALVPDASWFWSSLQRYCVPECCGFAAYDFSAESISWATGRGIQRPASNDWRDPNPGDPVQLASELRVAADRIRNLTAEAVVADLFNEYLTPQSCAELFEDLAHKLLLD